MKTPKNWDLHHKITQFKHFQAEYTKKIRTFIEIFLRNWEILTICYTANLNSNNIRWESSEN